MIVCDRADVRARATGVARKAHIGDTTCAVCSPLQGGLVGLCGESECLCVCACCSLRGAIERYAALSHTVSPQLDCLNYRWLYGLGASGRRDNTHNRVAALRGVGSSFEEGYLPSVVAARRAPMHVRGHHSSISVRMALMRTPQRPRPGVKLRSGHQKLQ